jgi:hypothetical protein
MQRTIARLHIDRREKTTWNKLTRKLKSVAPGKNGEIVNRQTDLSVEVFDAFAVLLSKSRRYLADCLEKIALCLPLCLAPRCGTTVALIESLAKNFSGRKKKL